MSSAAKLVLDFIDKHKSIENSSELVSEFSRLLDSFGFTHFIMTGLPSVGDDVERLIVANAWPDAWTDRYREQRYFLDDPVTQWSLSQVRAFTWHSVRDSVEVTPRSRQIEAEAADFGLLDGIGCPTPLRPYQHAVVSLASDRRVDLPLSIVSTIQIAAGLAHQSLSALAAPPKAEIPRLTQREKDILQWAALGRTRADIATILGISDGTVKTHLSNILLKLEALNSTHAVVIALMCDQIRI